MRADSHTMANASLEIDVYFDLICPWCLIGKRHLEKAIEAWGMVAGSPAIAVRWHSVQLIPGVPEKGLDFGAFYRQRLGSAAAVVARQGQVRNAASEAGVDIQFERILRFPNTLQAHQMLAHASRFLAEEKLHGLVDALMCGYFQRGADLGDLDELLSIGHQYGLDPAVARAWIVQGQGIPEPVQVPGVPFFVFNQRLSLSGAQPCERLLQAMQEACHVQPQD